jgi:hypothetical protein
LGDRLTIIDSSFLVVSLWFDCHVCGLNGLRSSAAVLVVGISLCISQVF